jgi:nifR3 family TIM-barrel protein
MLAPMEGVSHPELRAVVAARGGVGIVCTEFVRVTRSPIPPDRLRREVVKAEGLPLSVQVMGNEAERMAEAAAVVADAGADVVDVNVGCPMPRIVRKGVGAAMLKDPVLLSTVLATMRARTPVLLSAKIRAGFDDAAGTLAIGRVIEEAGVDFLVVHPRRRCDFYDGVADWRIVAALAAELSIPVVGNGDVWYAADVLRMERETGCAAVMIGRPALRNPWIFRQAAELRAGATPFRPSGADVVAHVAEVAHRYVEAGLRNPPGKLKELLRFVGRAIDDGGRFIHGVVRERDVAGVLAATERAFAHRGPDEVDLDAHGTLALERSGSCDAAPCAAA